MWTKGGSLISKCRWAMNWMLEIVLVNFKWGDYGIEVECK